MVVYIVYFKTECPSTVLTLKLDNQMIYNDAQFVIGHSVNVTQHEIAANNI